jgi:DNA processing protein
MANGSFTGRIRTMTQDLSPDTQAALLLTAPLITGRGSASQDILTPGEYKRLTKHLKDIGRRIADVLSPDADSLIEACDAVVDAERLRHLLDRGFLLSQLVEQWQSRAIRVLGRSDADYPARIIVRLGDDAPPVLYCCGDAAILDTGGLAVVGSRNVGEALIEYTIEIGHLSARSGATLVSGGAKGIDQAAMRGAIEVGGRVIGVLADSLERTTTNREHRDMLLQGQLVLISPYDPNAGFNVGNAMQRNKLIYALADAALIVSSDIGKGGTWTGAVEQLDRWKWIPVYVRLDDEASPGLNALHEKGALPWPAPRDLAAFTTVFDAPPPPDRDAGKTQLSLFSNEEQEAGNRG